MSVDVTKRFTTVILFLTVKRIQRNNFKLTFLEQKKSVDVTLRFTTVILFLTVKRIQRNNLTYLEQNKSVVVT